MFSGSIEIQHWKDMIKGTVRIEYWAAFLCPYSQKAPNTLTLTLVKTDFLGVIKQLIKFFYNV